LGYAIGSISGGKKGEKREQGRSGAHAKGAVGLETGVTAAVEKEKGIRSAERSGLN